MSTIIGLTGLARSGKDTLATALIDKNFAEYSFATPMKEACKIIFDWNEKHVNGELKETIDPSFGVSPRVALQALGTSWGRETINKSLWLIRAQNEINKHKKIVITDVRFNNEAEMIKKNGGVIIEVTRKNRPSVNTHKSESGISKDLINYSIENNGTIKELHDKASDLLAQINKSKGNQ